MSEPPDSHGKNDGPPPTPDDRAPLDERLARLEQRLQGLEEQLGRLAASITGLTATGAIGPEPAAAPAGEPGTTTRESPATEVRQPQDDLTFFSPEQVQSQTGTQPEAAAPTGVREPPAASPGPTPPPSFEDLHTPRTPPPVPPGASLEARIGQIWVSRAGLVLVLVALALFLKWAYDRNLVSHQLRTALGVASGLALLGLGEVLRRRSPRYAQAFTGAGIAALYVSFYAAYALYHLFGQTTSFVFMVVTTALAVALAVRLDAPAIAGLGILGGFIVPYLLAGPTPRMNGMLVYYLILQAGLLVAIPRLGRFKEVLLLVAVVFGYAAVALPAAARAPVAVEMWLLYFLLLTAGVAWLTLKSRALVPKVTEALVLIMATLPFLVPTVLGPGDTRPTLTLAFVLLAYVGFLALDRRLGSRTIGVISVATAAALLGTAFIRSRVLNIVLEARSGGWSGVVVCGVICVLAVLTTARTRRGPSYVVVVWGGPVAILHLLTVRDLALAPEAALPVVMMLLVIASVMLRLRPGPADIPLLTISALLFGGYLWDMLDTHDVGHLQGTLTLALAGLYAVAAWQAVRLRPDEKLPWMSMAAVAVLFLTLFFPAQFDTVTVTVAWAVEAAVLTFLGLTLRERTVWQGAWAVLVLAALRYFLYDAHLPYGLQDVTPFLNAHTVAALTLTTCSLLMAARLSRGTEPLSVSRRDQDRLAGAGLSFLIANGVLLLGMTLEIDLYFESGATSLQAGAVAGGRPETQQFVLTACYALHSIVLVLVGLQRSIKPARVLGLVLFTFTLAKLILVDLSFLDTIYRVFSFLAVGVLLVLASLLYQRFRERLE